MVSALGTQWHDETLRLPDVVGELCVHTRLPSASCRACIQACPLQAWTLDEETLWIEPSLCDGCGLCVPACPEGAIRPDFRPQLEQTENGAVAFAICEHAGRGGADQGLMPCLHAIGLGALLDLYSRGVDYLIAACGHCDSCKRGSAPRLGEHVQMLNRLLSSRGARQMGYRELPAGAWQRVLDRVSGLSSERRLGRRAFFRDVWRTPARRLSEALDDNAPPYRAPASLLPQADDEGLYPFVPSIDPKRCDACDACIRLCPHQALRLDETQSEYRLDASQCTGCGICLDVCERQALKLETEKTSVQKSLALRRLRCRACGVEVRLPETARDMMDYCRVCKGVDHHAKLYQVLD